MEMKKITKACFEEGQSYAFMRGLTQWDQGQYLEISGLNISNEIVEVHFSLDEYNGKAERMLGEVIDGVIHTKIPQFIMEGPEYCCGTSYNAYAWVYVSDEESAETKKKIELEIAGRSKPDEYVTPEELSFLLQLEAYIGRKVDKSGHAPNMYLGTDENGNVVTRESSGGVTDEQVGSAVEKYLDENPIDSITEEEIKKMIPTKTSQLDNDSGFATKDEIQSSGLTREQIKTLDDMFKKCAFTGDVSTEYEAFKVAFGLAGGGEEEPDTPVEPDVPEDVTLTSISATYTGGNVVVGTSVNSLTGITVKATYSDGSTKNVTGYTLSGAIAEGNNTITVSYGGMTTTFTVTGVAESGGETTENPFDSVTWTAGRYYYGVNGNGADQAQDNDAYSYTDLLDISGYNNVVVDDAGHVGGIKQCGMTFYDSEQKAISYVSGYFGNGNVSYPAPITFEIPENAVYVRLSMNTEYIAKTIYSAT